MAVYSAQNPLGDGMRVIFPAAASTSFPLDAKEPGKAKFKGTGPIQLTVICSVLLSLIVVSTTGLFLADLRNRDMADNERTLSNTAVIIAKQIEHLFATVENVQKDIIAETTVFGIIDREDGERKLTQYNIHLKLRDKAAGMPYVGSLTIVNAQGRMINFSRQWPVPDIDVSDRDFFKAFQSDSNLTTFIGAPVRNRVTGTWVMHLARKISGPSGEFLGLTSAAIELEYLQNNFSDIAFEPGSGISLFRDDGMLLARNPRTESEIGRRFPAAVGLTLVSNADHGVGVSVGGIDGQLRLVAAHRIGSYPLLIATTKTVELVFTDWKRTATYAIVAAVLIIIAIAAFAILFVKMFRNYQALIKVGAQQESAKKLLDQSLQFKFTLDNMPQGVMMFDASSRIVVCNDRYLKMYGLSAESVKPGLTLLELIKHRKETGSFQGDPDEYCLKILNQIAQNQLSSHLVETTKGRTIHVLNRLMADGGWVATHEDVTEAKRREESFRLLFEGNPVPMWVIDWKSLRFIAVNDAAVTRYGYSREQFLSMTAPDLRPAADRNRFAHFLKTQSNDQLVEVLTQHAAADGSLIDVCVYSRTLTYAGHDARMAVIQDITKIKLAEDGLRSTQDFLNAIVENVPLPIIVKSAPSATENTSEYRFTLINRAAEQFFGITRDQMIGKCPHDVYSKDHADFIVGRDNEALQGEAPIHVSEHAVEISNNDTRIVITRKVAIRDDKKRQKYLLTLLEDVTEKSNSNKRIAYLAHNDSLTDLPNRATFVEHFSKTLDEASKSGEQFAVLCLDLDRFKEANDTYGHLVGDELLRETARRLRTAVTGAFLARIGGDEFSLIIKDGPQPASAEALGKRVLAAFKDDFEVDGHRLQLGLSIGAAVYPADGPDAKTLMANADAALYQAKAETRGSVRFFEAELGARLRDRRDLQKDIKLAITRGEFFLHYQPQEKMASNETVGFEALVRWQCPKRGLVAPGSFIPVAEESSLIIPLGEWILREACREAASWPEPLTIAVNISPIQFHHGDLPALVHSILLDTGLAPARLELEITEGVLIDDFSRAVSILRRLKSLGLQIAMDDFGSGYSSLSYLHSFPFDKIKIDRSFIGDLEHNHHSMAIVRAIITLGHSLDVPVLAEGVETEAQRQFLIEEGCDEVQGYLTGRPHLICDYARRVGRQTTAHNDYVAVAG